MKIMLDLEEKKQNNQNLKSQIKSNTMKNLEKVIRSKSKNAEFRKSQKQLNEEIKKILKDEDILHKKAKNEIIKSDLDLASTKKQLHSLVKRNQIKEFLNEKINAEKDAIISNEAAFKQLVKEEKMLYTSICNVHYMQEECKLKKFFHALFNYI